MKNIIFIMVLLAVFTSCQKSSDATTTAQVNDTYDVNNIYGHWQLITYSGGATNTVVAPTDQIVVYFNTDGSTVTYTNLLVTSQDNFTIIQAKSLFTTDRTYQLSYLNSTTKKTIAVAKKDTLILWDEVANGYNYLYTRAK
jgi:hypothetical protein